LAIGEKPFEKGSFPKPHFPNFSIYVVLERNAEGGGALARPPRAVYNSLKRCRRKNMDCRTSLKTAEDITSVMRAHRVADAISAGVELGVFDALASGGLTAAATARKIKCSARGCEILMNALAAAGVLRKKADMFSLTPLAKKHLISGSPESMARMIAHSTNTRRTWIDLQEAVKTGRPIPKTPERMKKSRERLQDDFILAMRDMSRGAADDLAAALDLARVDNVLDVGGGPGTFLFAMIRRKPSIRGVIFDLPQTISIADRVITEEGFSGSVGTMSGDFNIDEFGDGLFNLVLMSSIIHINSPAQNKKLIKKGFRALRPGGSLVVRDFMLDDTKTAPADAALFSVNMLVNTEGGASYSESEIRGWMAGAGFERIRIFELPPRSSICVGYRPAGGKTGKTKKK
jgi:ubiquinone/menaquinone biosynthesis C-methylase UbiE